MEIDNEFTVSVPIDRAWTVLTDLEGIAPCLPGAQLTAVEGDVFSGKVKIKVGPVVSEYAGTARFLEQDGTAYRAVIDAKGKDSRGAGNAAATIHAQLREDGDRTVVSVHTDLTISGKIAQFGSGMIKEVSAKLLGQFATNLESRLSGPIDPVPAPSPSAEASPELTPALSPESSTAPSATDSTEAAPTPGAGTNSHPADVGTRRTIVSETETDPLDLFAIAGGSVYKRAIPAAAAVAVLIAIIVYFARQ
jgi:carbon monoxide dehydrogenase subunit G